MVLILIALALTGFVFPLAWLVLVGLVIYLVASRKSRRSEAIESRVRKMVAAGKGYAVFADLYFESARSYAIEKGAKAAEKNAASAHILVDARTYFVVFTRAASGGTMIGVEDAETVRNNIFDRSKIEAFLNDDLRDESQTTARPSQESANNSHVPCPSDVFTELDFPVEIFLVTQSGKVLMTSEGLQRESHELMDGTVFEIMVKMQNSDPFFIYYKCEDYYFLLMQSGSYLELQRAQKWRVDVSERVLVFLREYILHRTKKDIGNEMVSYQHNAKHTNVVAYIDRLDGWYPIKQNDNDHEDTAELRVSSINRGETDVSQFIAISELSLSA